MADKICCFCKHFSFDMGDPGWSEETPGWDAEIECSKNHWKMSNRDGGSGDFRENIQKASTCPDWKFFKDKKYP